MNSTQKAIVATWLFIAAIAFFLVKGWWLPHLYTPLVFPLLWQIRRPIDDSLKTKEFVSLKKGLPLAYMVFSIIPMAWFVFRLFSTPNLPDTIWWEWAILSIPSGILMASYDCWLYSASNGLQTAGHHSGYE